MNVFEKYHPIVILLYFISILVWNLVMFDPILLSITLLGEIVFYLYLHDFLSGIRYVMGCVSMIPLCSIVNMLLNHRGVTVLFDLGGLPVTKESAIYGCLTGLILSVSLLLFGCYNHVMTSEKIMGVFGGILPGITLIFSMALRLVPKLRRDYHKLKSSHPHQRGIVGALVGFALEDSIETGISMKYRGYGQGKRTSIYVKKMNLRDMCFAILFFAILILSIYLFLAARISFDVYPYVEYTGISNGMWAYVLYALAVNQPMLLNAKEEIRWKRIVSRI